MIIPKKIFITLILISTESSRIKKKQNENCIEKYWKQKKKYKKTTQEMTNVLLEFDTFSQVSTNTEKTA